MYMILWWQQEDDYLTAVHNENGSIMLFETTDKADKYANKHQDSDNMKVISINS
jgi:hypothetical protein